MSKHTITPESEVHIHEELKDYTPLARKLLASRGITTAKEAQAFFSPDYDKHTHDPLLLKDMEKAVERIFKAIEDGETICIYSDYDMDGIPGAVVLKDFFKQIGYEDTLHYIPHRNTEGFGLNTDAIERLHEQGITLLITVDCGIADVREVREAGDLEMDVIITDHHLPNGELPPAHAIVNPKQEGCSYPFKDLCGAAVVFKLVQALILHCRNTNHEACSNISEGWDKWLLDMVGMATIADMVPLVGENRAFAYYGLKVLRKSRRSGLLALFEKTRVNQRYLTEEDIGFSIGPRINAASRMDHPMDAFNLLSTENEDEARKLAEYLEKINNERKGVVAAMVKEARKKIESRKESSVIVAGNPGWKPGLLGLVCNALVSAYNKPAFVWGREGANVIKGSCRSENAHVLEIMQEASEDTFIAYGGHAYSGGFSVDVEHIHTLPEELEKAYEKAVQKERVEEEQTEDAVIAVEDISWDLHDEVQTFAPFGEGNPKPLFLLKDARIDSVEQFGKAKNHMKLSLAGGLEAIAFFSHPESYDPMPSAGRTAGILGHIEKNTFGWGKPSLRVRIVDIV